METPKSEKTISNLLRQDAADPPVPFFGLARAIGIAPLLAGNLGHGNQS
jgi:hypothetical protein